MRAYELMVIFDGDLDDSNAAKAATRVTESAGGYGATVEKNDWWGRRKFLTVQNCKLCFNDYGLLETPIRAKETRNRG